MTGVYGGPSLRVGDVSAHAELLRGSVDPGAGAGTPAPLASLYFRLDTGDVYRKSGALDTDWTVLGSGTGGGPVNELWGERATVHPADDEFNTNAVGAQWLQTGFSGNLNFGTRPVPYANPVVNAASWENLRDGDNSSAAALAMNTWLRIQPGLAFAGLWQPLDSALFGGAVPTDLFAWARLRFGYINGQAAVPGDFECGLTMFEEVGGGINFAVHMTMYLCLTSQGVANTVKAGSSRNPGSGELLLQETSRQNFAVTNDSAGGMYSGYIGMQKRGNQYDCWLMDDGGRVYMDGVTSVGFADVNAVGIWVNNNTGGLGGGMPIFDIDFVRFYEGIWVP